MNTIAIVTIVSNNYLHFARTLMQSVARQHPAADRFVAIVDRDLSHARALAEEFAALELGQLDLPDGDEFLFRYDVLELNTAVKPWVLRHLLARGYRAVVYLDPDIWLYRPLTEALDMLAGGCDLVLTPHLLAPVTDMAKPGELDVRRAGVYNLGFCALRQCANAYDILRWWQGKLRRHCIVAFEQGIFVDQSWMDLAPGLFPGVGILRHPGYNVAYWNIAQRPVEGGDDDYRVLGAPLVFFHFSGLDPLRPQGVSKYQDRYTLDDIAPVAADLIRAYCRRVVANGIRAYRGLPYAFGFYDNGVKIEAADRLRFRNDPALQQQANGRPFARPDLLAAAAREAVAAAAVAPRRRWMRVAARNAVHLLPPSARRALREAARDLLERLPQPCRGSVHRAGRRLLGWLRQPVGAPAMSAAPALALGDVVWRQTRPSPYGGLHAVEPDSARQGVWVGPRLDLPVCQLTAGRVAIAGVADLGLLSRDSLGLRIHGPHGLLHEASIDRGGPFELEFDVPADAFDGGCQWTVLAGTHVAPKAAGMSEDPRRLSWRVRRVEVDGRALLDSARSPVALGIDRLFPPAGVNLIGYLSAELGVGEAARSLARACRAAGIAFSAVDVGFQSANLQRDDSVLHWAVDQRFPIDLIYVNADQTPAISAWLQENNLHARYRIGYWHWEQPELPPEAMAAFAHVDEVWAPSAFVHDAIAPFSPVPVVRIPHALEFSPSPGVTRRQLGLPEDKLLVLVMYDFHSYQYRKNPQAALAAFRAAAAGRRDVALVLKTINGDRHAEAMRELRSAVAGRDDVIFMDRYLTRQEVWDLESCCDILLSLHRAEGFGLAPAEMMYLGKAVVATGWSANMDFMTVDNSFPVRYELRRLTAPVGVYPAGQLWAEADVDHAAHCLRRLLDDPALRATIGAAAARDVRAMLSPAAVGAQVRRRLATLGFWLPWLRRART